MWRGTQCRQGAVTDVRQHFTRSERRSCVQEKTSLKVDDNPIVSGHRTIIISFLWMYSSLQRRGGIKQLRSQVVALEISCYKRCLILGYKGKMRCQLKPALLWHDGTPAEVPKACTVRSWAGDACHQHAHNACMLGSCTPRDTDEGFLARRAFYFRQSGRLRSH